MVMSKMLDKLEGMVPAQYRDHTIRKTAITRHQLNRLISDMTQYNINIH